MMAGKKNGRRRHILVDTLGNLLLLAVLAADIQDRDGGMDLVAHIKRRYPRIAKIWADQGYTGDFVTWLKETYNIDVEITKRSDDSPGFVVIPWRWVVERTFAWLIRYRRLSKDYEFRTECSESMIYLASCHLMLKRLSPKEEILKPHRANHNRRYRDPIAITMKNAA
jgi:putative transposase